MSRLRVKFSCEIDGEDVSDETMHKVELHCARICEDLEARLATAVKSTNPDVTISFDPPPGDEWKGES